MFIGAEQSTLINIDHSQDSLCEINKMIVNVSKQFFAESSASAYNDKKTSKRKVAQN